MRIAMIDPSLFTLPYDSMLATGLRRQGHEVALHGRRLRADDGDAHGTAVLPSFYRASERGLVEALPAPARLAIKGLDHVLSMAGLRARLGRERPDIIHFQWLPLPVVDRHVLPALRRIAPLVLTVHDSSPFNGNPTSRMQQRGATAAFGLFDRLILHTEQGRARLAAQGIPPERIAVVPHGLYVPPRPPEEDAHAAGDLVFLLFGKLKPYKGLDLLIEAFARLPGELQSRARVRAIGKPYMDLAPLREAARRLGVAPRIAIEPRFVADAEIPALFGPRTVAVFPYREIEASGVLSLALSHARPVLASRIGSFAETVRDGTDGILVPPEDVQALAGAMARFIADPGFVASCARNIGTLAGAVPDWTEIGRRTAEVYRAAATEWGQALAPAARPGLRPATPRAAGDYS